MQNTKENLEAAAKNFGLGDGLIKNLLKSEPATQQSFTEAIKFSGLEKGEQKIGNLLYCIATKLPNTCARFREPLSKWVGSGDIAHQAHLDYAIEFIKVQETKGGASEAEIVKECGVGQKLKNEEIEAIIHTNIQGANEKSKKFEFLAKIKDKIPSVEGKLLKDLFEAIWKQKGLPDKVVAQKQKKEKKPEKGKEEQKEDTFHIKDLSMLVGRQMKSCNNPKDILQKHKEQFGEGAILTRFPPEPNGYLHIGHCRAMRFDFMLAKAHSGKCYLRYDDTNPTKENQEYIDNINENVRFMGYDPWKVTHSSENFDLLYQYAVQLIKQGDAFICSETSEVMRKNRSEGIPSKDRDRPAQDSLRLFDQMKKGLHEEGSYSLRAKIDIKHPNTTLRDPVIYRIKFHSHPHVGNKWCVYPLYDYTHPLCDSIEGITHSLCSLEFEIRRQLYYWPLEKLNLYRASQWQFSRLNVTYTVLSKRKLHELIFQNHVSGWDDPRLLTINGMRRRGYNADILNNFIDVTGVSRKGNENFVQFAVLENEARKYFDVKAPRTMSVLSPVEVVIEDLVETEVLDVPLFPKNEEKGSRKIKFSKRIYVESSDVKLVDEKGFYGIAPNKVVGLKYAQTIFIKEVISVDGEVKQVIAQLDPKKTKPNSYLNWISVEQSFECEVRNFGLLFNIEKPAEVDNHIAHLNPKSIEVLPNAKIHVDLLNNINMEVQYQFQRKGFYCLDKDTDLGKKKLVWNQIVSLVDRKK